VRKRKSRPKIAMYNKADQQERHLGLLSGRVEKTTC
jgi:hypothetical protein